MDMTSEKAYGRETKPTTHGRGKKDKSRDTLANMEERLAKVGVAMVYTREGVDLIDQSIENGLEDIREQIQDLHEGVLISQVQLVSHEEFMSFQYKVMSIFANMESMMEALASRMEAWDHKVRQELVIYMTIVSAWVMASHEVIALTNEATKVRTVTPTLLIMLFYGDVRGLPISKMRHAP